ncbi:MAG TPA: translation initiation factor IF-3 [Haliangiales bacterium]|nr:translation initiation factor IF-3 [Haliangiales bacterium]
MSRPFSPRSSPFAGSFVRVNGKIRAREVRVVAQDGKQLGVFQLGEAINMARAQGVDLVEIAPNATPPVCRLVDYGKFRYEQAKKDKEARKHHHANKVKEVQLSPTIDPHDFGVKVGRAVDFLCDEMKVKVTLRFRGREMAHQEFGFQVVKKFIQELAPYGHPDADPKLIGKGINLMLSPLPRNKRAKNPNQLPSELSGNGARDESEPAEDEQPAKKPDVKKSDAIIAPKSAPAAFGNSPFAKLDLKAREENK